LVIFIACGTLDYVPAGSKISVGSVKLELCGVVDSTSRAILHTISVGYLASKIDATLQSLYLSCALISGIRHTAGCIFPSRAYIAFMSLRVKIVIKR
jgi:hypothetical protein